MNRSKPIRAGIIGCGSASYHYASVLTSLRERGLSELVAACDMVEARRVMAMTGTAIPKRIVDGEPMRVEVEDNAHVLLDFGDSVFAVVTTGFTMQAYRCPAIELYGNTGTLQMLGDDWAPTGYEIWQNEIGDWQTVEETDPDWHWTDGLRHLVECIHQNQKPIITPEHAYHVLEIMLKAQESSRDGQAKRIESRFVKPVFPDLYRANGFAW